MAMILSMFCFLSSLTALFTDSTSGRNLTLGPGPGLDNLQVKRKRVPHNFVPRVVGFLQSIENGGYSRHVKLWPNYNVGQKNLDTSKNLCHSYENFKR